MNAGPDEGEAAAPPRRRSRWRWLVLDLVILVVVGGGGAAVVTLGRGDASHVTSRSALVVQAARVVSAPVAGTVTVAPAATAPVRRGELIFRITAATGAVTGVRSPVSGTVASIAAMAGAVVEPGATLATLVPTGRMEVVAMVSEDAVRHVHPGQSATIALAVDPGATLHGRVLAVWPQTAQTAIGASGIPAPPAQEFLKQTALVPVTVSLDAAPPSLASGESAEVSIDVAR